MGKNTALYVLACTTAVSTAAVVYLLRERMVATGGPAAIQALELQEPRPDVRASPQPLAGQDDVGAEQQAKSRLESEERERSMREIPQPKTTEAQQQESLAKAVNNPAFRSFMLAQQTATIEMLYRDFFGRGQLSPAQVDRLKALLIDHQMEVFDKVAAQEPGATGIPISGGPVAPAALETQIAQLIGNSEYQALQSYRTTLLERMQVNELSMQLTTAAVPLTNDQSTTLLNIMLDEKARLPPPARSTDLTEQEFVLKRLEWANLLDKNVGERADQVLTSDQLRVFRRFQQQQVALRANSRLLLAPQGGKP